MLMQIKWRFTMMLILFFFCMISLPLFSNTGFAGKNPENLELKERSFRPPYLNNRHHFIRNYYPLEYKGQNQVYEIVRDKRGIIYFGNNVYGIMEYDSVTWRNIPLANNNTAFSLSVAEDNTIYVGGYNELGYIKVINGTSRYYSLKNALPEGFSSPGVVSSVKATDEGVYFKAGTNILRWYKGSFSIIRNKASVGFGELFMVREKVFTVESAGTVYQIDGDQIKTVFKENPLIYGDYILRTDVLDIDSTYEIPATFFILPYGEKELLLNSFEFGLVIIGDGDIRLFENEAQQAGLIDQNYAYGSVALSDGTYAISTTSGVVIINQKGKLVGWINEDNGLINNSIRSILADDQNFLWVGTSYGISQILYPSPFSIFNSSCGIKGQIRMSTRLGNAFYVTTSVAAYRSVLSDMDPIGKIFQKIPGIEGETGYIKKYGNSVLIGNINGFFQIIEGQLPEKPNPETQMKTESVTKEYVKRDFLPLSGKDCRFIEVSKKYPGTVYVGTPFDGLFVLQENNNIWNVVANIKIDDQIFFGAEDSQGVLWISGVATGGYSLDFSKGSFVKPEIKNYYTNEGFPEGWYVPSVIENDLYLYTDDTFLRFNQNKKAFLPDKTFFNTLENIGFVWEAPDGNVWGTKGRPRRLRQYIKADDGNFQLQKSPFQRFNNYQIRNIAFDINGTTWFGAGKSLLSYDPRVDFDYQKPFSTLIRKVTVNNTPVFGDGSITGPDSHDSHPILKNRQGRFELPHDHNNIRFDFAGPYVDIEFANRYQVWMEGLSKDWSEVSGSSYKEYNSLPPADYTFHVRSENIYGTKSMETMFHFTILLPWWEKNWFYVSEALLFLILLIISIIMTRSGNPTRFSKTVTLISIVIVFEFIMMKIEPLGETFSGGIPLIQLFLNVMMAMAFGPAQDILEKIISGREIRRKLQIRFEPDSRWTGGTRIPENLQNMDNMEKWIDNFKKKFDDIGRKYVRYIANNWILDKDEKTILSADLEDFFGVLVMFRRHVTKDQPNEFSILEPGDQFSYHIRIFEKQWRGNGTIAPLYAFDLSGFVDWYQTMINRINEMFSDYEKALEDNIFTDREREHIIDLIEYIFERVLVVAKALSIPDDKQHDDMETIVESLKDIDIESLR